MPFFTFLLLLAVFTYLRMVGTNDRHRLRWLVGILFALVALARPEGVLLTLGFEYLRSLQAGHEWKRALKPLFPMALTFGIIYLPYFLWRWQYFGYFFPNTYYAKTGAGFVQIKEGISYLSESLNTTFSYSLVGLCLGFAWV